MTDLSHALQGALQRRQQGANNARAQALQRLQGIPVLARQALGDAPRNWIALECLANAGPYAKPDTEKRFVLWEARRTGAVHVELGDNVQLEHPWVIRLFLPIDSFVRFPFNSGDSSEQESLSWRSVDATLRRPHSRFYSLPRWSTASRSSAALVPRNIVDLPLLPAWPGEEPRQETQIGNRDKVHLREWTDLENNRALQPAPQRFYQRIGDVGLAVSPDGLMRGVHDCGRLYSIKTGVHYVGSTYQGPPVANKHLLEANSTMAMLRSNVVRRLTNNDRTFGVQPEILTITAPMQDGTRDGFQVRDLSCLRRHLAYLPGQAIPYARWAFDGQHDPAGQCEFWRQHFAVPLGRAKARLFLNYGLIHTSANAQNFVLGFPAFGRPALLQFVVRDLGDTSWHDDFICDYLFRVAEGHRVWSAFRSEAAAAIRHVLHETSSGQYPAPEIVRLAANSVITHGFGTQLGWSLTQLHRFVTGVFDGFLSYIREVLGQPAAGYPVNPTAHLMTDGDITQAGEEGSYPHPVGSHGAYCTRVEQSLLLSVDALLDRAAFSRSRGPAIATSEARLRQVINAEELFLCVAIERLLRVNDDQARTAMRARLRTAFQGQWPAVVPAP